ncbi:MAG: hypothetical protein QW791_03620 [Candidatus Bathyarchaeia archaeon]
MRIKELTIKFSPKRFIISPLNTIIKNHVVPPSFALFSKVVLYENSAIAVGKPNPKEILKRTEIIKTSFNENVATKIGARDPIIPKIIQIRKSRLRTRNLLVKYAPRTSEVAAPKKLAVQTMHN